MPLKYAELMAADKARTPEFPANGPAFSVLDPGLVSCARLVLSAVKAVANSVNEVLIAAVLSVTMMEVADEAFNRLMVSPADAVVRVLESLTTAIPSIVAEADEAARSKLKADGGGFPLQ